MPGGRIIRSERSNFKIGTTFSCSYIEPLNNTLHDKVAAVKVDALLNRMFLEPLLGLGYPVKGLPLLSRIYGFVKNEDEAKLSFDMDFVGIQNYTREMVTHAYFMPLIQAKIVKAEKRNVETTLMNWEVYPSGIYFVLKKICGYKNIREIIITENGAAFNDKVIYNKVHDEKRVKFLRDYISQN